MGWNGEGDDGTELGGTLWDGGVRNYEMGWGEAL